MLRFVLPSGEVRKVFLECKGYVGQVGNIEHEEHKHRKSGERDAGTAPQSERRRHESIDHPMGGG